MGSRSRSSWRWCVGALVFAVIAPSCATVRLPQETTITVFGEAQPGQNARLSEAAATTLPAERITILSGRVPAGIDLRRSEIAILPRYRDRYQVRGTVIVTPGGTRFRSFLWSHAVDETWAKILCYPQAPLKLASLGIWGVISPLNWPCIYRTRPEQEAMDDSQRFDAFRRAATVMGGNLVLVPGGFVLQDRERE